MGLLSTTNDAIGLAAVSLKASDIPNPVNQNTLTKHRTRGVLTSVQIAMSSRSLTWGYSFICALGSAGKYVKWGFFTCV